MTDLNNNYLLIYLARFKNSQSFLRLPFVKSGFAVVILLAVIVCTALFSDSIGFSIKDISPSKKIEENKLSAKPGRNSIFDQKQISS